MRRLVPILAAAIVLAGCKSSPPAKPVTHDVFHEQAIYAVLKEEPVPLPESTPYDRDYRQREVFKEGFRGGWDRGISGALLHGTFGTPTDLTKDMSEIWSVGWKSGAKLGSDRWLAESQRLREGIGQPGGSADGSQPSRSEANRSSEAAGSRR